MLLILSPGQSATESVANEGPSPLKIWEEIMQVHYTSYLGVWKAENYMVANQTTGWYN